MMSHALDLGTPTGREQAADAPPVRMVAGAMAHLARLMETGCPRSAYLAAMLLEKVAADTDADGLLRHYARELADILDRVKEGVVTSKMEVASPLKNVPKKHSTSFLMSAS